jgi:hypothetical protein
MALMRLDDGESGQLTTPLTVQHLTLVGGATLTEAESVPNYNSFIVPNVVHGSGGGLTLNSTDDLRLAIAKVGALYTCRYGDSIYGTFTFQAGSAATFVAGSTANFNTGSNCYFNRNSTLTIQGVPGDFANLVVGQEANTSFANRPAFNVAAGASPFQVVSDTVVSNLNADLFDGYQASAFVLLAGVQTITGQKTFSTGGGTPFGVAATDTGLVTHLNADMLDGLHASDFGLGSIRSSGLVKSSNDFNFHWSKGHSDGFSSIRERVEFLLSRNGTAAGRIYFMYQQFGWQLDLPAPGPTSQLSVYSTTEGDHGPYAWSNPAVSVGGGEYYIDLDGAPDMSGFHVHDSAAFRFNDVVLWKSYSGSAGDGSGPNYSRYKIWVDDFTFPIPTITTPVPTDYLILRNDGYNADDLVAAYITEMYWTSGTFDDNYIRLGKPAYVGGRWEIYVYIGNVGEICSFTIEVSVIPKDMV